MTCKEQSPVDIHACKYRLVKRNPKNVFFFLKHRSKRGNRLDKIPHSTYIFNCFKGKMDYKLIKMSILPIKFVFFTAKYKRRLQLLLYSKS